MEIDARHPLSFLTITGLFHRGVDYDFLRGERGVAVSVAVREAILLLRKPTFLLKYYLTGICRGGRQLLTNHASTNNKKKQLFLSLSLPLSQIIKFMQHTDASHTPLAVRIEEDLATELVVAACGGKQHRAAVSNDAALSDGNTTTTAAAVESSSGVLGAANRTLDDVDPVRWGALLFLSSLLRWSLWHPFRLAMIRQRTSRASCSSANASAWSILRSGIREHGLRFPFRGVGCAAFGNAFGETSYIAIFELMRHPAGPLQLVSSSTVRDSCAGTAADVLNVLLAAPFDVISARQMAAGCGMAAGVAYGSAWRTARDVYRTNGTRGFFAGSVPGLMYSPSSALWWAMYEPLKGWLYRRSSRCLDAAEAHSPRVFAAMPHCVTSRDDNVAINAAAGVFSSVCCTTIYNPVLVVAARLQVGYCGSSSSGGAGSSKAKRPTVCGSTVLWVLKDLWVSEGVRGLCKGVRVNVGLAVGEGILFSQMYEVTKWLAGRHA